jgi:hypothetical protein
MTVHFYICSAAEFKQRGRRSRLPACSLGAGRRVVTKVGHDTGSRARRPQHARFSMVSILRSRLRVGGT